jgi:cell division protein ZapA (FtsZ GTPase activity inhibitor)
MADELPITITIAGRPYRLTIARNEEETIRKAAKHIEGQISHYAGNYRYSDKQDLLAMVVLHFATLAINNQEEVTFTTNTLSPTLTDLDKILTEALED